MLELLYELGNARNLHTRLAGGRLGCPQYFKAGRNIDVEMEDRGNLGHEKMMQARGQLLRLAAGNSKLQSVRPASLDDSQQLHIDVDQQKANALGVATADINSTDPSRDMRTSQDESMLTKRYHTDWAMPMPRLIGPVSELAGRRFRHDCHPQPAQTDPTIACSRL